MNLTTALVSVMFDLLIFLTNAVWILNTVVASFCRGSCHLGVLHLPTWSDNRGACTVLRDQMLPMPCPDPKLMKRGPSRVCLCIICSGSFKMLSFTRITVLHPLTTRIMNSSQQTNSSLPWCHPISSGAYTTTCPIASQILDHFQSWKRHPNFIESIIKHTTHP